MIAKFSDESQADAHTLLQEWRLENPDGFFLAQKGKKTYLLHHVGCHHIGSPFWDGTVDESQESPHSLTTNEKICSADINELYAWTVNQGLAYSICRHCVDASESSHLKPSTSAKQRMADWTVLRNTQEEGHQNTFASAEAVMVRALPNPIQRELVLDQLLLSANAANAIAPKAWAVTLHKDGFRLNVGQVEALVFRSGTLRINIVGTAGSAPYIDETFIEANYRSLPQPLCAFVGTVEQFATIQHSLLTGHQAFIERAASTLAGTPRKGTSFRDSHSEALILYARSVQASSDIEPVVTPLWLPQEEFPVDSNLIEGARLTVQVNAYERNPNARRQCLNHYGMNCIACGFNFKLTYGAAATNHIHVHHLQPLASIGESYVVDPVADLRPVCANCHAVIHLRTPPYTIEELNVMLLAARGTT